MYFCTDFYGSRSIWPYRQYSVHTLTILMLNRRHLRVKVLQSLYAYFQSHGKGLEEGERELLHGIEKIYDMYLYQLTLLAELLTQEERIQEENRAKRLPSPEDLDPNMGFLENRCLQMIAGDETLASKAKKRGVRWRENRELVRKELQRIKQQRYFREYLESRDGEWETDVRFVIRMIKKSILPSEALHSFYEEKSIYWIDDWELVNMMLVRTLKQSAEKGEHLLLMGLYKDPGDKAFARALFHKTILNHEDFNGVISAKTKNWDIERIALMDMIIMEMALAEILKFPEIPVKVSLNEYIELSKIYSTPKSKVFVNGVLDKLVEEFIRDNKIPGHLPGSL